MIKIMVDSAADCGCGSSVYDYLAPLTVNIDGKEYLDGVNLDGDTFYHMLLQAEEFPKTSQPAPEVFAEVFRKVQADGDQLLVFSLSSALSGTYQSAVIAKEMVDYDGIYVLDTRMVSHMIEILAKFAGERIREGLSAEQILEECRQLLPKIKVAAGLDTLEYLYKGGRLSRTSATVGQIAGIKPVVVLDDAGKVNAGSKAIGVARAMQTVVSKVQSCQLDDRFPLYTLYTYGTENVSKLEDKLNAAGYTVAGRLQVGPTIGAHVGPDVSGVLYVIR